MQASKRLDAGCKARVIRERSSTADADSARIRITAVILSEVSLPKADERSRRTPNLGNILFRAPVLVMRLTDIPRRKSYFQTSRMPVRCLTPAGASGTVLKPSF